MLEYGAMASLMSGSGPTVFGMVEDRQQAETIAEKISGCNNAEIIVTRTVAKVGE
jgi:4-diphosphocytidyl-2-C-methyl-D-erythritol kinase